MWDTEKRWLQDGCLWAWEGMRPELPLQDLVGKAETAVADLRAKLDACVALRTCTPACWSLSEDAFGTSVSHFRTLFGGVTKLHSESALARWKDRQVEQQKAADEEARALSFDPLRLPTFGLSPEL